MTAIPLPPICRPGLLAALVVCLAGPVRLGAQEAPELPASFPHIDSMALPPAEHFLDPRPDAQRDWIVLKDGQTISALPVVPRPNTLPLRQQQLDASTRARPSAANPNFETWRRENDVLQHLDITIPELEPEPEYRVPIREVQRIIHHEDLWLQRIDQTIAGKNIDLAMELLGGLQQSRPDWPGLAQRFNSLLLADASIRLEAGRQEDALMLLEEVARRQPGFAGLAELASRAVEPRLRQSLETGNYREARYFLDRLQKIAPDTPLHQQSVGDLSRRAAEWLAKAKDAQAGGAPADAVTAINSAVKIWPATPGLPAAHKGIVERYQRVYVGVLSQTSEDDPYPFDTAARNRRRQLTEIPFFEVSAFSGGIARYRTRFCDEWVPSDLGRTTRFILRQTRQPWESQPVLPVWPVAEGLRRRLDPTDPAYDERFAGYVDSLEIDSPFEFTLSFRRAPPRLEALLTGPIVTAPAAGESASESAGTSGAFAPVEQSDRTTTYRRFYPEPDKQRQYHVAEVVEVLYGNPELALTALQNGEVSVLPDMPAWIVRRVRNEPDFQRDFFLQPHAVPQTHVIEFNPQSHVLESRELRRALLYAVDRRGILDDVFLRQPQGKQGRVATGPFPGLSRASAPGLQPAPYDPYAGLALALAARTTLNDQKVITGDLPTLRMIVPSESLLRQAAQRIIDGWNRTGLAVELVPDDDTTAYAEGRWDLVYRTVQMCEPVVELWPFLTLQPTARIADLTTLPDWLKQEMLDLDRAADARLAEEHAQRVHKHLALEAALLPLWELDQFSIYRKTLRGFPVNPIHCYDNIDEWVMEASLQVTGP